MEAIINCTDIGFSYNGTSILNGINLSIQPGNMLGILGANGAGKSTLLKILCGVLKPKSGKALFNDKELSKMDRREIAKGIAYIPQDPMFAFPFTVREVVLMGRAPYIGRFEFERETDKEIAQNALVDSSERSPYGTKYIVDGELETPNGVMIQVRTIWIIKNDTEFLVL